MVVAILMGRKSSKGFPGKNLYKIMGRPLAGYPMKAAADCEDVDKVYLSTDDERLMELAGEYGSEIIKRPAELCTDEALGEDVYLHAYNTVKEKIGKENLELLVLLMCNAATVTQEVISEGIKALRDNPEYDSAVTVSRYNMWSPLRARRVGEDGLLRPFVPLETFGDPKTMNCDRDSQGDVWFHDTGASVIRPRCLDDLDGGMLPQKWMGQKIYPLKQWGGCDIDYEWQVPLVEYWIGKHGKNPS